MVTWTGENNNNKQQIHTSIFWLHANNWEFLQYIYERYQVSFTVDWKAQKKKRSWQNEAASKYSIYIVYKSDILNSKH